MATMDPGQRGFGRQQRYNIPNLPFKDMRRQGPVDRFDESVGEATRNMPFANQLKRLFPQGQMPPQLLQLLMAQLMAGPRRRPPMGGGAPRQRRPMGGGQPPVVRMEDLLRALNRRGAGAPQADMPVPQARR
jgi:hypothetical protein